MNTIPAWEAGLRQSDLLAFVKRLQDNGLNMHSVLLARHGKCFFERYWEPFDADTPHRMYSVTKSFVSIAIGCLVDEGKLNLDDPIIRYFPDKLPEVVPQELKEQTIRDMLMMCTCFAGGKWFQPGVTDRTAWYFAQKPDRPSGTLFHYDSTGSYVLGVLVERLSGMGLLEYLRRKVLDEIGGFENAEILETPDGTPWGDSALLCTPRDLMRFARFVMQKGMWEGRQLVSRAYVEAATSRQTDNNLENGVHYNRFGYGYQFWMTAQDGFSFNGMGGQFAVCLPQKDLIFVCTGDNQLASAEKSPVIFDALFECIVSRLQDEPLAQEEPLRLPERKLPCVQGEADCETAARIAGKWFVCKDNRMQITRFRLDFPREDEGVFTYVNAQGEKQLPFGFGKNVFGLFPQLGYSDQRGNVHEITDFRYRCASSAGWIDGNKLRLHVHIIDRYFGQLAVTFGFRGNAAGVRMVKSAEDFLDEYEGWLSACLEQDNETEA
ncbi:MAG: serine hydrolase [Clostridia bacterium]|nr:serine hydrolase [Clostridia bacterium]